jgi:hypothetical protein
MQILRAPQETFVLPCLKWMCLGHRQASCHSRWAGEGDRGDGCYEVAWFRSVPHFCLPDQALLIVFQAIFNQTAQAVIMITKHRNQDHVCQLWDINGWPPTQTHTLQPFTSTSTLSFWCAVHTNSMILDWRFQGQHLRHIWAIHLYLPPRRMADAL